MYRQARLTSLADIVLIQARIIIFFIPFLAAFQLVDLTTRKAVLFLA